LQDLLLTFGETMKAGSLVGQQVTLTDGLVNGASYRLTGGTASAQGAPRAFFPFHVLSGFLAFVCLQ
jgi:hypothetical protein